MGRSADLPDLVAGTHLGQRGLRLHRGQAPFRPTRDEDLQFPVDPVDGLDPQPDQLPASRRQQPQCGGVVIDEDLL